MKLFVFKLKIPESRVQRFSRRLLDCARAVGIVLSSSERDPEDPEDSGEHHVMAFICQAPASLTPEQITALMAICSMNKAEILGISYTEVNAEDEDDPKSTVRTLPVPSRPKHLRLAAADGESVDDDP